MKASINKIRLVAALVAAVAAAVALGACGGGSSTAADQPETAMITRAELIAKADPICSRTDVRQKEQLAAYEKAHPGVQLTGAKEETVFRQVAFPPIGAEIKEVAALGTPAGDATRLKAIIAGWKSALKAVERKPILVMGLSEGPFTRPDKLAHDYGFKACSKAL